LNSTSYLWIWGDGTTSTDENPVHNYSQLQNQVITLIAINEGCTDSSIANIVNVELPLFDSIPNIITPNGDGMNDCFEVSSAIIYSECFSLAIFNRWGGKVFETTNNYKCWNGNSSNNTQVPSGQYYYIINLRETEVNGSITVIR